MGKCVIFLDILSNWVYVNDSSDGEQLGQSEKSRLLAGVDFGKFSQGCGGVLKRKKGPKKTPMALLPKGRHWTQDKIGQKLYLVIH